MFSHYELFLIDTAYDKDEGWFVYNSVWLGDFEVEEIENIFQFEEYERLMDDEEKMKIMKGVIRFVNKYNNVNKFKTSKYKEFKFNVPKCVEKENIVIEYKDAPVIMFVYCENTEEGK